MKQLLLSILLLACATTSMAQDIEVKSMKQVKASTEAGSRKDINGTPCGLVRVQMAEEGAQFDGNIIGDVTYRKGEYLLYMSKGSKRLSIKHPKYIPITIVFSEFKVSRIESESEYQIATKLHPEKQKKDPKKRGIVSFKVSPAYATLAIDDKDEVLNLEGYYALSLPIGTHYYSVTYEDFTLSNQMIKVEKEPKEVIIDISEFCPIINVKCQDEDAEIFTDDIYRSNHEWHGMIAPGEHIVQARKEGFRAQTQTITLREDGIMDISFDKLKPIAGSLNLNYEPIGADVYIDDEFVGSTPLKPLSLTPGRHKLRIAKVNCLDMSKNILIKENEQLDLSGALPMNFLAVLENECEKGDRCAMWILSYILSYTKRGPYFEDYRCCQNCYNKFLQMCNPEVEVESSFWLDEDYPRAIYWLEKALKTPLPHGDKGKDADILLCLSMSYAELEDYNKSFALASKCHQNYGKGKELLAWHYYYGKGVSLDKSKAHSYIPDFDDDYANYPESSQLWQLDNK